MSTIAWIFSTVTLLLGIIAGYAFGLRSGRNTNSGVSASDSAAFAQQVATQLAPVRDVLGQLDTRVHRLGSNQSSQLSTLTEQMRQNQIVDQLILESTQGLDSALRQSPKRGTWGEVSLRRVLEMSGLTRHIDFSEQVRANGGAARPDVVIRLPGDAALVIDAKVPLDAYLRASEDDERAGAFMAEHARAVRGHIRALAQRDYAHVIDGAVDSVLLFMPSEALISASFDEDPTLFEDALARGIIIVGPAGLMTLMRSVGNLWSRQYVTEDAHEILTLGRTLVERINVLGGHLGNLGNALTTAIEQFNATVGSFDQRLVVTTRKIASFEHDVNDPPSALEAATRRVNQTDR
ncbi:MAG: DNA recombination protein RmuC [Actinomycetaceae bacterium]|nr:DNA recombination protein RmuC [Actinomycetaceae bacterium]